MKNNLYAEEYQSLYRWRALLDFGAVEYIRVEISGLFGCSSAYVYYICMDMIISYLILKESITKRKIAGVALILVGAVLVSIS